MPSNAVLDFILGLLRDDETASAYCLNPQGALDAAGLTDLTPADIVAAAPLVVTIQNNGNATLNITGLSTFTAPLTRTLSSTSIRGPSQRAAIMLAKSPEPS